MNSLCGGKILDLSNAVVLDHRVSHRATSSVEMLIFPKTDHKEGGRRLWTMCPAKSTFGSHIDYFKSSFVRIQKL